MYLILYCLLNFFFFFGGGGGVEGTVSFLSFLLFFFVCVFCCFLCVEGNAFSYVYMIHFFMIQSGIYL